MRAEVATAYHWRFPRSVLARVIARDCDATAGVSLCRVWSRPPLGMLPCQNVLALIIISVF